MRRDFNGREGPSYLKWLTSMVRRAVRAVADEGRLFEVGFFGCRCWLGAAGGSVVRGAIALDFPLPRPRGAGVGVAASWGREAAPTRALKPGVSMRIGFATEPVIGVGKVDET